MDSKQIVNMFHNAMNERDAHSVTAYFHENASLTFIGAGVFEGVKQIESFLDEILWKQFTVFNMKTSLIIASDGHVACQGEINGVTAMGKTFTKIQFTEICDFTERKILRLMICYDAPSLKGQVGKW